MREREREGGRERGREREREREVHIDLGDVCERGGLTFNCVVSVHAGNAETTTVSMVTPTESTTESRTSTSTGDDPSLGGNRGKIQ